MSIFACLAAGCGPVPELRLQLAAADPDPLATAVQVRVSFDDGSGERAWIETALDGPDGEASTGLTGDRIVDLEVEALDAQGVVVARGSRSGDLTPVDGDRDERVLVLRLGAFSTVADLNLPEGRDRPCAALTTDGRVLVAGGGPAGSALLDLQLATLAPGADELEADRIGCSAVTVDDGRVVLAGGGKPGVEILDGDGALITAEDTGRPDGALAALAGGEVAWWAGGGVDAEHMTSDLVSGDGSVDQGPTIPDEARAGVAAACRMDGDVCAVFGSALGPDGWWQAEAADLRDAVGGMEPLRQDHDDEPIHGEGRAGAALGEDLVAGLTEDGDTTHLLVLDLGGDGTRLLDHVVPGGLTGCTLVTTMDGEAWVLGGGDGATVTAEGQAAVDEDGWRPAEGVPALRVARRGAAAVRLADGRIVVAGGVDADGEPVTEVEVYQP